jgi:hypothetical protein
MGEGLLLGLSWLGGSVSAVLPERKVVKVSSILCCSFNHVEVNFFYLISVFGAVLFSSGLIKLLDFLIYSVITVNTVFFVVKIFPFLCSSLFCKRCVFICLLYLSHVCLFLCVLGPWEFSGGPGHILSVRIWLRCVECRAGTILFGHFVGADGGTVQIFLSLWLCCSGYGTVEMVRGVVRLFPAFFSLLSVLLAVGFLW